MAWLSADCLFGLGGGCGVALGGVVRAVGGLGWGLVGWVWLVLVSSRAGFWASAPRGGWLVGRAVRWSVVVGPLWFLFAHFLKWSRLTQGPGIDRHPHAVGWSGISADDTFPR